MQPNTMTTNAFNPAQSTNYASKYTMPNPQMPASNYSLANTGLKAPASTALNASGATNLSLSERNKLAGQNKLNAINNATSAENLPKPKWVVGAGKGNYTAQRQAYNAKAQEFGLKAPALTPEQQAQKAAKSQNAAQYALAGIDTAVNLANAGMSYANMAKQWEFMRDSMNLARDQYNDEKERYNKREQERLNARDDARGAQQAVFGQKQWHDPDAQGNDAQGGEGEANEPKEEETSFTRA